ncbi:sulfate ABC transporter permease subunit CysT [Kaistia dalseonensis]|uniref:sulfate ABC transporter permease subunit CysT n=1 Tax=Kaistia dalseonensis TaxID=410840 RepID=UPI002259D8A2|nr:sulfate ABC transporter permease subunit CysT [Kaistia dalseonensis]MCX5493400.1 sulfate ABC transporter permease subunit CysT [Kaistia dalseonensis]
MGRPLAGPAASAVKQGRVVPGFRLSLGVTLVYAALVICLPLATLIFVGAGLGFADYWQVVTSPRALASYRVTLLSAALATAFNTVYGFMLAWVLVRYDFPGRRLLDAIVDLPFALPTAVAGIALTALFAKNGWFGAPLLAMGIKVAYTPIGIAVAMAFTSLPFIVRTLQPVLEELDSAVEEAARTLGAGAFTVFRRVVLPILVPALLAGVSLAFARSLGEFGAVIFIAGNQPYVSEITALVAFIKIEEYDYPAAAAIATVMLGTAFIMLVVTNALQAYARRHEGDRR